MNDFIKVSPLKLLDMSSGDGLGKGNLGVLIARAGVGKTACLIHIAFDMLFRKNRLVHVSLEDTPEKVTSYYQVIFSDLIKAIGTGDETEGRFLLERNRMILAYLHKSFEITRLRKNLENLKAQIDFVPDILIVDGLDFEKVDNEMMQSFKKVAEDFNVEIWFSALSHRHITEKNEKGIPYPCSRVDELLSVIIQLETSDSGILLKLIKDHDYEVSADSCIRLDPSTFLATT
jgi:KaiC/GvpD/RAD55 family RecA-like ATPase